MSNPRWTARDVPDQTGRRAIVTGANSGIGFQTALELARHGATVVMTARNAAKGAAARSRVLAQVPSAQIEEAWLDLASLASVQSFAESQSARPLDLLINNAGVMAPAQAHERGLRAPVRNQRPRPLRPHRSPLPGSGRVHLRRTPARRHRQLHRP